MTRQEILHQLEKLSEELVKAIAELEELETANYDTPFADYTQQAQETIKKAQTMLEQLRDMLKRDIEDSHHRTN